MKKITVAEYDTRFPNNNSIYFSKLNNSEKEVYINCLTYYYSILISYLIQKLDLVKHDQNLSNSKNNFVKVPEEKMDIYQYLSSDSLQYLYLRNNIYLDRLSSEEIQKLINFQVQNANLDDKELVQFIESTYPRLIDESPNKETITTYGPESKEFMANSKSLVIGLRIDDFFNADAIPNWSELHDKREMELDFFITYLKKAIENKIPVAIDVIRYNDFSVKKKSNLTQDEPALKF